MSDFFLADDLSGALDAAAAFHCVGREVTTVLTAEAWGDDQTTTAKRPVDVFALTTETRNAAPTIAAEKVVRILEQAHAGGHRLLFKKIDSTMRGPVAAELAAVLAAMPEVRVLFTPANPAVGRTVRDGVLLVHGVPVAETDFARDPVSPVRESALNILLGAATDERVVIADAATQDDLDAAVKRMNAAGVPWVGIGSGALARAVAAASAGGVVGERSGDARVPGITGSKRILMVCGSAHAVNRAQAERLRQERGVRLHEVRVAEGTAAADAVASLEQGWGAALAIEAARRESAVALHAMVMAAEEAIRRCAVRRVFVTGGETAHALCGALGISALKFRAEIEAGMAISEAEFSGERLLLVVKPGGFGDEQAWVRGWDRLAEG